MINNGQMLCPKLIFIIVALTLTLFSATGNPQTNGKKSPINLIRNSSSKADINNGKPTLPAGPSDRPVTAIDPISHVRYTTQEQHIQIPTYD
jgi:hypothetical protein